MPSTKARSLTALAAALALGLTACGGNGGSDGGSGEPLQLGYVFPETGDLSHLGPPQIESAKYAVQEMNDAGGVLGEELPEILAGDEANDAAQANDAADRLLGQDVDAILGAASSGMTMAIIDRVTGEEVVQCSGSNTAPALTDYEHGGYYFRTAPSDLMQGPVLAETILGDGYQSVAIVHRADDYGQGLADAAEQALKDSGAEVALNEGYDPNATNFDSVIQDVANADTDAVLMVSFEEGVQIISGLLEAGLEADQMFSADGLRDETLAESVDEDDPSTLAGFKGTAPGGDPEFNQELGEAVPDLEVFQFAPQVYDCAILVGLAAESAGSTDPVDFVGEMRAVSREGTSCSSFAECRDLIAEGEDIDYEGKSGPVNFDDNGNVTASSFEIYGFDEEGQFETIDMVESSGEPGSE